MSALLTPEEQRAAYRKAMALGLRTVEEEVARAQLRKVVEELEALEPFDHDTWNFGVAVRKWVEAARKEIDD